MPIEEPSPAILREAAARALAEDVGPLDITTAALVSKKKRASARIFTKETAVLSGLPVAQQVFWGLGSDLTLNATARDGDPITPGQNVLEINGPAAVILTAERSALNFLQHLSGIATQTRRFVDAVAGTKCTILDTRKTTPGLRHLEKYAVLCGGGANHRMGLYDCFMPKDNHVALMDRGGLKEAVARLRLFNPDLPVIFEADTLEQVAELAGLDVTRILLDNMTCTQMTEAVALVHGRCQLEASGNMTLDRVAEVAATGVDFISIGSLTHSVRAIDFSLEIIH